MIFTQWREILSGYKTQTRRVVKPGETLRLPAGITTVYTPACRVKWATGRTYAVVPKRGARAIWLDHHGLPSAASALPGARQMRIRITNIRKERLQAITKADAVAEGWLPPEPGGEFQNPLEWYHYVWDSINTRAGTAWYENPEVWVLTFELVR